MSPPSLIQLSPVCVWLKPVQMRHLKKLVDDGFDYDVAVRLALAHEMSEPATDTRAPHMN